MTTQRSRGLCTKEDLQLYEDKSDEILWEMLDDSDCTLRSIAVKLLLQRGHIKNINFTDKLLSRLTIERCLYTRLAITDALSHGDESTIEHMVPYLGKIGNNQLQSLPSAPSKKKSYPLPRDIISRTLAHMDKSNIPYLLNIALRSPMNTYIELIDAIGFQLFYNPEFVSIDIINNVHHIMETEKNTLLYWKCIVCLSSFTDAKSTELLKTIVNTSPYNLFRLEAQRTLTLINRRLK